MVVRGRRRAPTDDANIETGRVFSLSPGERAGVRGKKPCANPCGRDLVPSHLNGHAGKIEMVTPKRGQTKGKRVFPRILLIPRSCLTSPLPRRIQPPRSSPGRAPTNAEIQAGPPLWKIAATVLQTQPAHQAQATVTRRGCAATPRQRRRAAPSRTSAMGPLHREHP